MWLKEKYITIYKDKLSSIKANFIRVIFIHFPVDLSGACNHATELVQLPWIVHGYHFVFIPVTEAYVLS